MDYHRWIHRVRTLYLDSLVSPATVCLLCFSSSENCLFPPSFSSSSPSTPHEILLSFLSSSNDLDLSYVCLCVRVFVCVRVDGRIRACRRTQTCNGKWRARKGKTDCDQHALLRHLGLIRILKMMAVVLKSCLYGHNWPESSPGPFWLDRHVAGATEAGGTAGTGDRRHVAHIAVWRSGRHVVAAAPLFCIHLKMEVKRRRVGSSVRTNKYQIHCL